MSRGELCVKIPVSRYQELLRKENVADAVSYQLEQEQIDPKVTVDVLKCVNYIYKSEENKDRRCY